MTKVQNNTKSYSLTGILIGLMLGLLAGVGAMQQVKMSQRGTILPFALVICGVSFAASGYKIGKKLGREEYIEKCLGIDRHSTSFDKKGRYWFAITSFTDMEGRTHTITTDKEGQMLTSRFNSELIKLHGNSASYVNVEKSHKEAKGLIFSILKEKNKNIT